MTKPGVGNTDSFCSKLDQASLKELVKIPCEHNVSATVRTGRDNGQVTKEHGQIVDFFKIKMCFSEPACSQDSKKVNFVSARCLKWSKSQLKK